MKISVFKRICKCYMGIRSMGIRGYSNIREYGGKRGVRGHGVMY